MSRYAICKAIGLNQGAMSRFMSGQGGLSMENVDRIGELLDLELRPRNKTKGKVTMASVFKRKHISAKNALGTTATRTPMACNANGPVAPTSEKPRGCWPTHSPRRQRSATGYIDGKAAAYRSHESRPLAEHIDDWQANLVAQGSSAKHAEHASNRVRRLVAVMLGANEALDRPSSSTTERPWRRCPQDRGRHRSGPAVEPDPREGSRCHRSVQGRRLVASDLQPLSSCRQGVLEMVLRLGSNARRRPAWREGVQRQGRSATRPPDASPSMNCAGSSRPPRPAPWSWE